MNGVSILGLGFVGLSIAVYLAHREYDVIASSNKRRKAQLVRKGIPPFFEPDACMHEAIEQVGPDQNGERQLSDALQILVDQRDAVYAVELARDERRIDIGDPISYKRAFLAESI